MNIKSRLSFQNILLTLAVCIICTVLSACGKKEDKQPAQAAANTPAPQAAVETPKAVAAATPAPQINPTINAAMQAARETAQLAVLYSKEDPALAKLITEKRNIFQNNQETLNKKISALNAKGKELIEKEDQLTKAAAADNKAIAEKRGVGVDDIKARLTKTQSDLTEIRKQKGELTREVLSTPEMRDLMKSTAENVKKIDEQIASMVKEIKAKKEAVAK